MPNQPAWNKDDEADKLIPADDETSADSAEEEEESMRSDLDSGECFIWNDDGFLLYAGKTLGRFSDFDAMLQAVKAKAGADKFYGPIYSINDHGNVTAYDYDGNIVGGWI